MATLLSRAPVWQCTVRTPLRSLTTSCAVNVAAGDDDGDDKHGQQVVMPVCSWHWECPDDAAALATVDAVLKSLLTGSDNGYDSSGGYLPCTVRSTEPRMADDDDNNDDNDDDDDDINDADRNDSGSGDDGKYISASRVWLGKT